MSDCLPIFLRAHTVKVQKESKSPPRQEKTQRPRWPEYALILDAETRTSIDQTLMVIVYRICKLVDGQYRCEREGLVYDHVCQKKNLTP